MKISAFSTHIKKKVKKNYKNAKYGSVNCIIREISFHLNNLRVEEIQMNEISKVD